jgi:hypothetical protein
VTHIDAPAPLPNHNKLKFSNGSCWKKKKPNIKARQATNHMKTNSSSPGILISKQQSQPHSSPLETTFKQQLPKAEIVFSIPTEPTAMKKSSPSKLTAEKFIQFLEAEKQSPERKDFTRIAEPPHHSPQQSYWWQTPGTVAPPSLRLLLQAANNVTLRAPKTPEL